MSERVNTIDAAFASFEEVAQRTGCIRLELIESMRSTCNSMKVATTDPARLIEVKMAMINTLSGLLKDYDNAALQNVKLRLSQEENNNKAELSVSIAELLKQVTSMNPGNGNPYAPDLKKSEDELNKKFTEANIDITDDEVSACGNHPKESGLPEPAKSTGPDEL